MPYTTHLATSLLADEVHDRDTIERLVLGYLLQHPAAADSIDGVRLWWLREAGPVSQTVLNTVLDELFQRGWLATRGDRPETRIYSLNDHARAAVERFLAHGEDPGECS